MFGGVQAVTWTDVKQMYIIVFGLLAAVVFLVLGLPETVSVSDALTIAGATGRLQVIDFSFDPNDHLHVLVRHARGAVPLSLVLRHRPEPGAALSHRAKR